MLTVNYCSAQELRGLAASLRRHAGGLPIELIVTNNSPEQPVEPAGDLRSDQQLTVEILESENVGFGSGINLAYRKSRGDIIFIANPDVRVAENTLTRAESFLRTNDDVGVLMPRLRYPDGEIQPSIRRFYTWPVVLYARSPLRGIGPPPRFFREYLMEFADRDRQQDVDWGLGAAMFLRRAEIERLTANSNAPGRGPFDERFFLYFEDVDLCCRVWQKGRRVVYLPEIECVHDHRRSSRRPLSRAGWHHFKSLIQFVAKYHGLPNCRR
ncbi:MAG: glycosyltransferase [Phycisphaerae bacterium]|nr:glycosyltransferase [Phycisphaerae bacterium]